jgi:nucleoid DNA-binding protein
VRPIAKRGGARSAATPDADPFSAGFATFRTKTVSSPRHDFAQYERVSNRRIHQPHTQNKRLSTKMSTNSTQGVIMNEENAKNTKKPMNKTEVLTALSETTSLTKQQVSGLLEELTKLIGKNLGEEGPGAFVLPGLLQIKVVRKPATPERKGVNPFTKEEMVFKAKPAKNVVKVSALKGLKDLV